jgi:hypothetical protein
MSFSRSARCAALALALAGGLCVRPCAAASNNLLANPGFEIPSAAGTWMPAAWDTFQSGLPTVFFGRDTVLAHGGRYAVSVASVSDRTPMWMNWSQTILVGRESWGKDLVFSVWTRSAGVQGRGYVLVQAFRDTVAKMAKLWGIDREAAGERMRIQRLEDPSQNLAWKRVYFSDPETDWVRRELRVYCPPLVNLVTVRAGVFGTGQVMLDDASLTLEPARAPEAIASGTNLLADPGFEGDGNSWEYSIPPYEGLVVRADSSVAHSGRAAIFMQSTEGAFVKARTGVAQVVSNRGLAGKRMRVRGYVKADSLKGDPYVLMYCTTARGDVRESTPRDYSGTLDWTLITHEFDVPPNTYQVWVWFLYDAPVDGKLWWDDVSLEVVGAAKSAGMEPMHPLPDH